MGAEDPRQDADAAGAARRRDRPADPGHHRPAQDQPRHRLALRHPAAADRRHAVRRLRPAPGRAVFHTAQQLSRDPGNPAGDAGQPRFAEQALSEIAADRRPGAAVDVRDLVHRSGSLALDQPPGPVPGDHDQLQPRPGRRARPGHGIRAEGDGRSRRAGDAEFELPGHGAGVPAVARHRAAADPRGAGRGLSDPRHPLRELHPPDHDSVDPALGRRRRARDPDGGRLRVQPDCFDRRHSADRHREEERHHDGRLRHRRRTRQARRRRNRSGRPRCSASARS